MRTNTGWSDRWKVAVQDILSYASVKQLNSCFIKQYYELSDHNSSCYLYPCRLICSVFPITARLGQFGVGGREIAVRRCARIPYFKQYVTKQFKMKILYYFVRYVPYYKQHIQDGVASCLHYAIDLVSKGLFFKKKWVGDLPISKYPQLGAQLACLYTSQVHQRLEVLPRKYRFWGKNELAW